MRAGPFRGSHFLPKRLPVDLTFISIFFPSRCPNYSELGDVRDNTAHSTGRHGMKVSNFFPLKGGYMCPNNAISEPAKFRNFTAFKNRHMGIWGGEFP